MNRILDHARANPKRIIFAEGEEEKIIRAAVHWRDHGYGTPVLVGRKDRIITAMERMSITDREGIEITNAALSENLDEYVDIIYRKLQRRGFLYRDAARMVKNDRNSFAACMLEAGHGDAVITGLTRSFSRALENISRIVEPKPGRFPFAVSIIIAKNRTIFMSDTMVNELPEPEMLADIAECTAEVARRFGHEPRVALLSFSNFGNPQREKSRRIIEAVQVLDSREVDFEYDGEMGADVALNKELMSLYPFCRLSGPANVLVMPALHTANVASGLMHELGNGAVIGPILVNMSKPIQVIQMNANVSDIINMAAIAAMEAAGNETMDGEKKQPGAVKAA